MSKVRRGGGQMSRLRERYQSDVIPELRKEFGYANVMAVPKLDRIVVNMGLGEATQNAKLVDVGTEELKKLLGNSLLLERLESRSHSSNLGREWR